MNSKSLEWDALIKTFSIQAKSKTNSDELVKKAIDSIASLEHFHWTGIYWLKNGKLELGYYKGKPTDHTTIEVGQGVCGTAIAENRGIIINDVLKIENYLACSAETRSEIVVLIKDSDNNILGQIDADSDIIGAFDEVDKRNLEIIAKKLGKHLSA